MNNEKVKVKILLKPAPGKKVFDKEHKVIPESGILVNKNDVYYFKRVKEGSAIYVDDTPNGKTATTKKGGINSNGTI